MTKIKAYVEGEVDIDLSDVIKAYEGKRDRCMCGCSGKYWYPKDLVDSGEAEKERGYPVDEDETSDEEVKRIFEKVTKNKPIAYNAIAGPVAFYEGKDQVWVIYYNRRENREQETERGTD